LNLLYGPGLASRFSFQRDGNTVLYKNGTAFFSLNEGGAFLGGNRVITTADLAVETARAMAAEAAALPASNPAVQGTLTVNRVVSTDNGGDDLNLLYGPGLASRFSFQRDGNTVLYKSGVAFFSLNEGGAFLGGSRVITTADLAVETARAMGAEAASLPVNNPAVQGTLTAGIFAAPGNGSQNLNVLYGPGLSYRLAGQNDGNLVAYVNNSPFLSISPKGMTFNGNTMATAGDLAALAARMQPMGNYVTAGNRGPTKTYNFDVVAAHGDWISFPDPFSGDAVAVVPVAQDTGNNQIHTSSWFRKDRSGFQLSCNVWTGSTWANEHNGVPVAVAVTGPA
ncbi:hypothetical protein DTI93_09305, partial [Parasaccharibacter sp. TMW 2.1884]|uniref:hypothetical protein n=1 Tax=Parasaccharibacter sp. TMW 2.1884 TaxID=2267834 RepID=UPI00201123B5